MGYMGYYNVYFMVEGKTACRIRQSVLYIDNQRALGLFRASGLGLEFGVETKV